MIRRSTIALLVGLIAGACGSADVDEGARCQAIFDLIAAPMSVDAARAAADAATDDDERRLFLWQAELADLVLDPAYEAGTLPDWEALGFEREPTVDEMAQRLSASAAECAGVSSA